MSDGLIEGYGIHDVFSWNDGFVYQARGAPSVTFGATGDDYWARYHTDYDDLASLDFASLAPVLEAEARRRLRPRPSRRSRTVSTGVSRPSGPASTTT